MSDRTCVITGASRGIGLATALRFAKQRCRIVAAARNEQTLDAAVEKLSEAGAECLAITADVGNPDDARQIISAAFERFGRIDVLVNNAGVAPLKPLEELDTETFDEVTAVNLSGVFHTTHAAWPIMKQQGGGVIINISSVSSQDPFPGFQIYGASKAWVNIFTQAVAGEGKPHGIRAYAVAPGAVETDMLRAALPDLEDKYVLQPDAVAAVIESLCDDRFAYTTGQTIFVRK
jgi:3-oxoacyl-[acyl-carrier protein] reductase